jgi:hypothetical protein
LSSGFFSGGLAVGSGLDSGLGFCSPGAGSWDTGGLTTGAGFWSSAGGTVFGGSTAGLGASGLPAGPRGAIRPFSAVSRSGLRKPKTCLSQAAQEEGQEDEQKQQALRPAPAEAVRVALGSPVLAIRRGQRPGLPGRTRSAGQRRQRQFGRVGRVGGIRLPGGPDAVDHLGGGLGPGRRLGRLGFVLPGSAGLGEALVDQRLPIGPVVLHRNLLIGALLPDGLPGLDSPLNFGQKARSTPPTIRPSRKRSPTSILSFLLPKRRRRCRPMGIGYLENVTRDACAPDADHPLRK